MAELRKSLPPGIEIIPPARPAHDTGDAPAKPWNKVLVLLALLVLYVVSPVDFIPDIIPLLGQLDDLLVGGGLLGLILRAVLKYYTAKHLLRSPRTWLLRKLFGRR